MYTELTGPAIVGFLFGGGLIVAIGAQNAFVLRLGLLRQHVFMVCLLCAVFDAFLIVLGIAGLGSLVQKSPMLLLVARYGGAAFLFAYGLLAFRRALYADGLKAAQSGKLSLLAVVSTTLAFTFLNPHVYLDTVVLLGSYSARYELNPRIAFGIGAIIASFVWFFGLGYGARLLAPIFAKPRSWQILDIVIGVVMWALGASLLFQ